jgi:BASS family bile acid:Na+ symporter
VSAVISLVSIATPLLLTAWSVRHFVCAAEVEVDAVALGVTLFLLTAVPVWLCTPLTALAHDLTNRVAP